jgi:hypothetical protein
MSVALAAGKAEAQQICMRTVAKMAHATKESDCLGTAMASLIPHHPPSPERSPSSFTFATPCELFLIPFSLFFLAAMF